MRTKIILTTLCVLIGSAIACVWMMFQYVPDWYRPLQVPPGELRRVKNELANAQDTLSHQLNRTNAPFTVRYTQLQLNSWLAVREEIWPLSREWLPEELTSPFVHIDEQGLRLAATFRQGSVQSVVSLGLEIKASPQALHIRVSDVSGGAIELPHSWIQQELEKIDTDHWPAGQQLDYQLDNRPLPKLSSLFEGADFPNTWEWWNGKQPFRITQLTCEPGALVLTLEPLPRQTASR